MAEENVIVASKPAAADQDWSEEIARTVVKQPLDRVTCKRISGNNYRCNWWSPASKAGYDNPRMSGMMVTTHVVRMSRFLTVTKPAGTLVVKDWAPAERPEADSHAKN